MNYKMGKMSTVPECVVAVTL